jgi:NADH-quinone oxidoreductase subunit F
VTVFEKEKTAGGMLAAAIPAYRLPRDILKQEFESLLNENIEMKYEMELGRNLSLDDLQTQEYDAVYLALGSHKNQKLGIAGEDAVGVLSVIAF